MLTLTGGHAPIRYMGTKRHLAGSVADAVEGIQRPGRLLDLFSGIGAVPSALTSICSVVTNDAMHFTTVIAAARFTSSSRSRPQDILRDVREPYRERLRILRAEYSRELSQETSALDGDWRALQSLMNNFGHVGNTAEIAQEAQKISGLTSEERYKLVTLYFACGYFSLAQSLSLDALRFAIDTHIGNSGDRAWLLSAWLGAASTVINSPGHAAQFFHVKDAITAARVGRNWRRNVWRVFEDKLADITRIGSARWRSGNRVLQGDALELIKKGLRSISCVYADPPYTKDQYSRYYHVLESMYLYDFPDSFGQGRYRSDRFTTGFCRKTEVAESFEGLARGCVSREWPLILSYPSEGLLSSTGVSLVDLLGAHFSSVDFSEIEYAHSTMGASKGAHTKSTRERIYVCIP